MITKLFFIFCFSFFYSYSSEHVFDLEIAYPHQLIFTPSNSTGIFTPFKGHNEPENPTEAEYLNYHGFILSFFKHKKTGKYSFKRVSSGLMVQKDLVLTCAHSISEPFATKTEEELSMMKEEKRKQYQLDKNFFEDYGDESAINIFVTKSGEYFFMEKAWAHPEYRNKIESLCKTLKIQTYQDFGILYRTDDHPIIPNLNFLYNKSIKTYLNNNYKDDDGNASKKIKVQGYSSSIKKENADKELVGEICIQSHLEKQEIETLKFFEIPKCDIELLYHNMYTYKGFSGDIAYYLTDKGQVLIGPNIEGTLEVPDNLFSSISNSVKFCNNTAEGMICSITLKKHRLSNVILLNIKKCNLWKELMIESKFPKIDLFSVSEWKPVLFNLICDNQDDYFEIFLKQFKIKLDAKLESDLELENVKIEDLVQLFSFSGSAKKIMTETFKESIFDNSIADPIQQGETEGIVNFIDTLVAKDCTLEGLACLETMYPETLHMTISLGFNQNSKNVLEKIDEKTEFGHQYYPSSYLNFDPKSIMSYAEQIAPEVNYLVELLLCNFKQAKGKSAP